MGRGECAGKEVRLVQSSELQRKGKYIYYQTETGGSPGRGKSKGIYIIKQRQGGHLVGVSPSPTALMAEAT